MCGRFVNLNNVNKINKIFEIDKLENFQNIISYNIAPTQSTIIITNTKSLKIEKAHWGFSFYNEKYDFVQTAPFERLHPERERIQARMLEEEKERLMET